MLKSGKEEIVYLLTKAIEKYAKETGLEIVQNTNRKNYNEFAIMLSHISNQLPHTYHTLGADIYLPDTQNTKAYPHRKYDITGGQVKDALSGIVAHPRSFLVDACYIYLFGVSRKAYKLNPTDSNLLHINPEHTDNIVSETEANILQKQNSILLDNTAKYKKFTTALLFFFIIVCLGLIVQFISFNKMKTEWKQVKADMNILPYVPTQLEIDSIEGIWLCYTGSPQARISDASRYHKVVSNIVQIKYKNGYFTYNRYGASFNHIGFVQFESPGIVSIYSRINNQAKNTESPRHSLLNLYSNPTYLSAISASWNFDVGDKNKIIGIREVYIKLGKGGRLEEVINEVENASCQCKIVRWHQQNEKTNTYFLKNQLIDSLQLQQIKPLINEHSILLSIPQQGLVIFEDSLLKK